MDRKPGTKLPRPMVADQSGAALMMVLMVLLVAGAYGFLSTPGHSLNIDQIYQDRVLLARTKTALVAYALLSDADQTGSGLNTRWLPCPDSDGDGLADSSCGSAAAEGWLPWRTLGIAPPRDSKGACLRYKVAGAYSPGTGTPPLKSSLPPAELSIHNVHGLLSSDVVAVISAPGAVLAAQSRANTAGASTSCGSTSPASQINQVTNYLEAHAGIDNASGNDFIYAGPGTLAAFNDSLIWISRADLQ